MCPWLKVIIIDDTHPIDDELTTNTNIFHVCIWTDNKVINEPITISPIANLQHIWSLVHLPNIRTNYIFGTNFLMKIDGANKIYHFVSKCIILLVAFYIINLSLLYKNF